MYNNAVTCSDDFTEKLISFTSGKITSIAFLAYVKEQVRKDLIATELEEMSTHMQEIIGKMKSEAEQE